MPRLLVIALLVSTVAACSRGPEEPYPPETVENFLRSCEVKGTKAGCECAIDKLQRAFTYEQFKAFETRLATGDVPSEMMNAIADCPAS